MSTNGGPRADNDLPVTYLQAAAVSAVDALMRYQLLERQDQLSKTAARARPQGRRRPPARHLSR